MIRAQTDSSTTFWLHLSDIDATTPDPTLYPEYDNELRQAMLAETRHLRELLTKNLPARNFIKSDFTFVNRRLAHHYGGQYLRRKNAPSSIAADSVRGGLMTSQHPEGHRQRDTDFSGKTRTLGAQLVLGTPPQPPPPTISALEPDIRGAVTIRETLAKHRDVASCASCHQHIDPPGFALESFNPIGVSANAIAPPAKATGPTTVSWAVMFMNTDGDSTWMPAADGQRGTIQRHPSLP